MNTAHFSPDRRWRYDLVRTLTDHGPMINVIGLNPSTADETKNDPTVTRCIGFGNREVAGTLIVTNIFAWRATNPLRLLEVDDPVGPENDEYILHHAKRAAIVICAWGIHGSLLGRYRRVETLLKEAGVNLKCFGTTASGHPKHPLYLKSDTALVPYE